MEITREYSVKTAPQTKVGESALYGNGKTLGATMCSIPLSSQVHSNVMKGVGLPLNTLNGEQFSEIPGAVLSCHY